MSAAAWLARPLLRVRRGWVQLGAAVAVNSYWPTWFKHLPCPGLNCYSCPAAVTACPIGGLQHFAASRQVPLFLAGALGLIGLGTGRLTCGWLCPFGLIQDAAHRLPTPKWSPQSQLPWLRYAVLVVLVLALPFLTGEQWFSRLCPAGTLEAGIPWVLLSGQVRSQAGALFAFKLATLGGLLGWMVVTRRPFCRYLCPLGAIYGLFNPVSFFRVRLDRAACSGCQQCSAACPVDIDPLTEINSRRCIHCLECVRVCSTGALQLGSAA
jgi:ferredoxin-type protein NapH